MATSYEALIREFRQKYDPWPWLEVTNAVLPTAAPAGTPAQLGMQRPYELVWDKMPFAAWDVPNPASDNALVGDMSNGVGLYQWSIGSNEDKLQQIQQSLVSDDVVGSYIDKWLTLPGGSRLRINQQWQSQFYVAPWYNGGTGTLANQGQIWQGLRGYRWYPKGSITPPQLSRPEIVKLDKWHLRAFSYAGTVTPVFSATLNQLASFQLTLNAPHGLNADFLIHRLRVRPQSSIYNVTAGNPAASPDPGWTTYEAGIWSWLPTIMVGFQPATLLYSMQGGQIQGGNTINLAPWTMFQGVDYSAAIVANGFRPGVQRLETQWSLVHPFRVKNNDSINLLAQGPLLSAAFDDQYSVVMEFVLDGELMIAK